MALEALLEGVRIAAVICLQYGDSGKGKFSDYLSEWADVIARGTGGNNAGHTVVVNGVERIYHLLPAGISRDSEGKVNVLGDGMVINPEVLWEEMQDVQRAGGSFERLMIGQGANVIMPWHIKRDKERNQSQRDGGIGSTGRGIGPCYADKIARRGIEMRDLAERDTLAKKIAKVKDFYPEQEIDIDQVIEELRPFAEKLEPFVKDTTTYIHDAVREGQRVLLEGAQGTLLSVEHGVHPYVTSSDCSINGTAGGVGLSAKAVDLVFGIVKFPFMTRVGGGPFPTELGGLKSEEYCAATNLDGSPKHGKDVETVKYGSKMPGLMDSQDEFKRGVGIRVASNEYGATTGRPRRVGWTDAVAARYAADINRPLHLILTKADSIAGIKEFKICYGYKYGGGIDTVQFRRNAGQQRSITPVYETYQGYGDIREVRDFEKLPDSLKQAMNRFEDFTRAKVSIVSVGRERDQTIVR